MTVEKVTQYTQRSWVQDSSLAEETKILLTLYRSQVLL